MKIYVASKFENKGNVRNMISRLQREGHEITHDWTLCEDIPEDNAAYAKYQQAQAMADVLAVKLADIVVLLPRPDMRGAFIEVGGAMFLGKPVICVSERPPTCFFYLRNVHVVATEADVPGLIKSLFA